ncbi:type 1 glutamine amidotransferase family protein [Calidifontibacter terrae]
MSVVLLGPQRRPSLDRLVAELGLDGPFVTITAGWQEREKDDREIDLHLGGRSRNLHLWHRMQHVFDNDPAYAQAHQVRRARLLEMQELYRLGLSHTVQFLEELRHRTIGSPALRESAVQDAVGVFRGMDRQHISRVREIQGEFYASYPPHERPAIAQHRIEVAALMAEASAVVIAGGHVVDLLDALHLFNVAGGLDHLPIIAWSAGAMALTSAVVLFDEHAVRGPGCAEVFDQGLGVLPGLAVFPAAHQRLRTNDRENLGWLAQRFAPSICLPLDPGTRVELGADGRPPADATVIDVAGAMGPLSEAALVSTGGGHGQAGNQPTA